MVVDFGDGPDTFLVDEFCGGGLPMSPLGQALVGAASGQALTYPPLEARLRSFSLPSTA